MSLSREPVSPTTQKEEWESSGMKNRGKRRRWSEEKGWEREAAPIVKKGYLAEIRLMDYHSYLKAHRLKVW